MKIAGFQKLTLLDYPGHTACTVFTGGCNFRCPFCHNAGLVLAAGEAENIPEETVLAYLEKRRGILDGVVITGGEPLLHRDIPAFLEKVKARGFAVKLDTNGSFPELLETLVKNGLVDYVAMDIKNAPSLYGKTAGVPEIDLSPIVRSKEFLMSCGIDFEFRTTLVKGLHTQESVTELARFIAGDEKFFLQQFKNSGNLLLPEGLSAFDEDEMKKFADLCRPYLPAVQVRGL